MTIALQVDQSRAEDLLGASQAPGALGLDPYNPPIAVWRRLRGMEQAERPAFVQEAAEWGQALEPIVRGKYALSTGRAVFVPTKSLTHDGWLRATPDGFAVDKHERLSHLPELFGHVHEWDEENFLADRVVLLARGAGAVGLWQGKTCSAYKRDEWLEGVPPACEVQVRTEMAVTNLPWCDVTCLVGGQKLVGPFRVERDLAIEDRILTDLSAFWRMVKEGREPTTDHTDAWRSHVSEKMQASKLAIPPDAEMAENLKQWRAARLELQRAEHKEAGLKTAILLRLSAAGAAAVDLGSEGKVTAYRTGAKPSWKEYAISLGGAATVPDRFKGAPGKWTLRSPWKDDTDGE